ncbi:MAG: hypothetical protein ABUS79_04670 [Pseudomonadota bacterium]
MAAFALRFSLIATALFLIATPSANAADPTSPPPAVVVTPTPGGAPPPAAVEPAPGYVAPAPVAVAANSPGLAPPLMGPSVVGILNWHGVGVGARFMFPLPIPALLTRTRLRDSWALEGGLDFVHLSAGFGIVDYNYNVIIPTMGMMWLVWLNPDFAVYPKVEAGYAIGFSSSSAYDNCVGCSLGGIHAAGAAGLLYKVSALTLRAEVGSYGIKGGLGWLF